MTSGMCRGNVWGNGNICVEGAEICETPPTSSVTAGCVHEHGGPALICADHLALFLAAFDAGIIICLACDRAGCRDCAVRVIGVRKLAPS